MTTERPGGADVSLVFELVGAGYETDVARDKDRMVGEAVAAEHGFRLRRPNSASSISSKVPSK